MWDSVELHPLVLSEKLRHKHIGRSYRVRYPVIGTLPYQNGTHELFSRVPDLAITSRQPPLTRPLVHRPTSGQIGNCPARTNGFYKDDLPERLPGAGPS
jgi:hypothetical protein